MKTVDPLPTQIASMNKDTVLKLLKLLMGGTLLQSGSDINVKVSRWAWALLARLPVRGELSSDEIGVIRELGKKAALLGVGLKTGGGLQSGLDEVEKVLEADNDVEIVDDEKVTSSGDVNLVDVRGNSRELGDQAQRENKDAPQVLDPAENSMLSFTTETSTAPELVLEVTPDSHELDAIKVRLLANITPDSSAVDSTALEGPQASQEEQPIPSIPEPPVYTSAPTLDWNTRATIDMILTIAGEMYGQRDLLEFREVWGE